MADGFKVEMDEERARQLEAVARERGVAPAELARQFLEQALEDEADRAEVASRWKEFEETGETIDHAEVIDLLRRRASGQRDA